MVLQQPYKTETDTQIPGSLESLLLLNSVPIGVLTCDNQHPGSEGSVLGTWSQSQHLQEKLPGTEA